MLYIPLFYDCMKKKMTAFFFFPPLLFYSFYRSRKHFNELLTPGRRFLSFPPAPPQHLSASILPPVTTHLTHYFGVMAIFPFFFLFSFCKQTWHETQIQGVHNAGMGGLLWFFFFPYRKTERDG
ncbi:hypothetical protein J3F83DRAFT_116720 [Trichoderma novae-zelandiae]